MKTKEKVIKHLDAACRGMNDNDTFIGMYTHGRDVSILIAGNDTTCSVKLGVLIDRYYQGDAEEGEIRIAKIIIDAFRAVSAVSPMSGAKFSMDMASAAMAKLKQMESSVDDDEPEDCEGCELLSTCDNDDAIAYRKANGIPKPKNGKKVGRKSNKK